MNQIPNIEETHNTREIEEMVNRLFDLTVNCKLVPQDLRDAFHHQLQKARDEEREKIFGDIEQFKAEVVTMDYCDDFKDGIYATIEHILAMPVFESVLDHSELDQPNK